MNCSDGNEGGGSEEPHQKSDDSGEDKSVHPVMVMEEGDSSFLVQETVGQSRPGQEGRAEGNTLGDKVDTETENLVTNVGELQHRQNSHNV